MSSFMKRNLKLYFRDRSSVFFSLLSVFIVIGLYMMFLGNSWLESLPGVVGAENLMNSWLVAGLLAVASVTTTMGAFGVMVEDRSRKILQDFTCSPIKRSSITGGYLLSAFVIGSIMSLVTLGVAELYLWIGGGELLSLVELAQTGMVILLSSLSNTAMVCFLVSFFRSQGAFTTASIVVGTLVGFLTGIYLPIGDLPSGVQTLVKLFPASHAAALLRRILMKAPIAVSFEGAPQGLLSSFEENMGLCYHFGDNIIAPWQSLLVLVGTAVVFYVLAICNMSRKNKV